jgi:hypothetical protein
MCIVETQESSENNVLIIDIVRFKVIVLSHATSLHDLI